MSTLPGIVDDAVADRDLVLHKVIPRSAGRAVLDLRHPDGSVVAGQWFASAAEAASVFDRTRRAAPDLGVALLGHSTVLLQPRGADGTLRSLHRLATAPGSVLVAHRPDQRGVVWSAGDASRSYTKVVRPGRLARTVTGARLTIPGVSLPQLLAVDRGARSVTSAELPGRTLFELLGDPHVSTARSAHACRAVGAALARLHRAEPPAHLPSHDAPAELAVTERWVDLAARYGLLGHLPLSAGELLASARTGLAGRGCGSALLHRDLHDKQVLLDGLSVGLLDFDLAAVGEPALDLANLLVHLELRALQGRCSTQRASACATAVLDGYRPAFAGWRRRTAAYMFTTRIRLACVYAFRPAHSSAGAALLPRRATRPSGVFSYLS